jgi:hypothetical protein
MDKDIVDGLNRLATVLEAIQIPLLRIGVALIFMYGLASLVITLVKPR